MASTILWEILSVTFVVGVVTLLTLYYQRKMR